MTNMICNVKDLINILTQWNPNIKVDVSVERDASKIMEGVDILEVKVRFEKYHKEDQIGYSSKCSQ